MYQTCRQYFNSRGSSVYSNLGWRFNCPTPELYNAYEEGDPRRDYTIVIEDDTCQIVVDDPWYHCDPGNASPTLMNSNKYTPTPEE